MDDIALKERQSLGLMRFLEPVANRDHGKVERDGASYWDFSSNDTLGLAQDTLLIDVSFV